MKQLIKKILPKNFLSYYHLFLGVAANYFYGWPSEKMTVIGVTGTNGKSTTVILIGKILEEAGFKVGATSTAVFKIADQEWLNDKKMTMLGRMALQKLLFQMVKAGCYYAVVETSSEGIKQHRHANVHYDIGVFTNLTPEHLESHGGFENYKNAKLKLFAKIASDKNKNIDDKEIKKAVIVNGDDEHAEEFLKFNNVNKISFGFNGIEGIKNVIAKEIAFNDKGVSFKVDETIFHLKLFGKFNVYNSLAAIAVAQSQNIDLEVCKNALEKIAGIPGRMEFIDEGQDFKVLVDYAPEPESLKQLYQTIRDHQLKGDGKIIHVLGSCGGGRDTARRPILGSMAAAMADIAIITNEDPYDDDPTVIIDQVAQGAISGGLVLGQNLYKIEDRREAIVKAVSLAETGDLVILTGKGSEQAICLAGGKKMAWDEREIVREILKGKI